MDTQDLGFRSTQFTEAAVPTYTPVHFEIFRRIGLIQNAALSIFRVSHCLTLLFKVSCKMYKRETKTLRQWDILPTK